MGACEECGALARDGLACRQQWDELLALEFTDARAGSVHFLTVACYQLQHPRAFPLDADARRWLVDALADVVVHGRPVGEIRDATRERYEGSRPVLGPPEEGTAPRAWSHTLADVGPPDPEGHVGRVRVWAAAVHADLDEHRDGRRR